MPSKNTRLMALLVCFTAMVFLSDYEPRSAIDLTVGVAAGVLATVATALALSLLEM
jgi:hypothetical protein